MNINKLDYDPLVRFHAELLHDFHVAWRSLQEDASADRDELGRTAFFLLEHAGMLYRYTADEELHSEMHAKPEAERRALAIHACHYADAKSTRDFLARLADSEEFEDEDLYKLQDALKLRDTLEVVSEWAHELTFDICCRHFDLEIARALSKVTAENDFLDDAFRVMPSYVLPALEAFSGIRELLQVPAFNQAWWLGDARTWLENANQAVSLELKSMADAHERTQLERKPEGAAIADLVEAGRDFVTALWERIQPALEMQPARTGFSNLFGKPVACGVANLGMSQASSTKTFELAGETESDLPDLMLTVQYRDNDRLRFTLQQSNGDRLPWIQEARLEMREQERVTATWQFSDKGFLYIDRFPEGKQRELRLMRVNDCLGRIAVPQPD